VVQERKAHATTSGLGYGAFGFEARASRSGPSARATSLGEHELFDVGDTTR
jgi:hypothetical protein